MRHSHDMQDATTARYALTQFTFDEFMLFWPKVEEMLDKVPHTWRHWTKEYILAAAEVGSLTMWGIGPPPDAVVIFFTTIHVYPTGKVFSVDWCAGHFASDMLPLLDATWTNFAKLQGCTEIEIRGRMGWHSHLEPIGFTRDAIVWSRKIPDMRLQ